MSEPHFDEQKILAIERPKDPLWTYYILVAVASLFAFPVMIVYLYFRFHTMKYRFDREGISMSWGVIFHNEIVLNYARIQDIHLRSNAIERWLGIARIEVQTASAGSGAEMTIEGLDNASEVRDFLYSKMRGASSSTHAAPQSKNSPAESALAEAAAELRAIRKLLEKA